MWVRIGREEMATGLGGECGVFFFFYQLNNILLLLMKKGTPTYKSFFIEWLIGDEVPAKFVEIKK